MAKKWIVRLTGEEWRQQEEMTQKGYEDQARQYPVGGGWKPAADLIGVVLEGAMYNSKEHLKSLDKPTKFPPASIPRNTA